MNETTNTQTTQTQQQPLSLVVDDRKISVPVVNRSGEQIGVFSFDPLDIGMVERYNEVSEKFTQALQNIQTGGGLDALNEAGDKIIEFLAPRFTPFPLRMAGFIASRFLR